MGTSEPLTDEFAFVDWIRKQTSSDPRVPLGIGDDAAAVRLSPGRICLITTDTIIQAEHFDLATASPEKIGRKAIAINLSDLAAMAGLPMVAVVGVALPRVFPRADAEALYRGMQSAAEQFNVAIVGGDTVASPGALVVSVTLVGEATGRGPVRRSDAQPGDWIMVTGSFGGSILGKHLEFTPRVRESLVLHERCELHAMIDVSDGLAADLGHIAKESSCGAVLRAAAIPISDAAKRMGDGRSALEHALGDGEDFELLFTVSPDDGKQLLAHPPFEAPISQIGTISSDNTLWLETEDGSRRPLEPIGYDHFRP